MMNVQQLNQQSLKQAVYVWLKVSAHKLLEWLKETVLQVLEFVAISGKYLFFLFSGQIALAVKLSEKSW